MFLPDFSCLAINDDPDQNEEVVNNEECKYNQIMESLVLKRKLTTTPVRESVKRRKMCIQNRSLSMMKRSLSFGDSPLSNESEDVTKLFTDESYIADGSRPYCLPLTVGQHRDVKSITSDTMKDLLEGQYDDVTSGYRIIDCRYPYEYNGGHIKNAENCYREDQINELLLSSSHHGGSGENEIVIFHCEFSSNRGPKLLRHMRKKDRETNSSVYPRLNYPEVYLLEGGYKTFFNTNTNLCNPAAYIPMLHEEHKEDIRHFRSKTSRSTKTCSREIKRLVTPHKLLFSVC